MRFPRYPKYKASGVEWLGDIPEGWEVKRARAVGVFSSSGIDKKSVDGEQAVQMFNYLDVYNSHDKILRYSEDLMWTTAPASKVAEHSVLPGDILLTPSSETADDIGHAARVASAPPNILYSYHILRFRKETGYDASFLTYCFNAVPIRSYFESVCTGTTRKVLVRDDFKSAPFAIPSLAEQTAIADFLDGETGKIDGLVAEQRRLVELLKEKISSLVLSSVDSPNTRHLRLGEAASIISRPVLQQQEESYTRVGLFNRGRGLFHKDASEMDDMGESDFFWIEEGDLIISGQFAWEGAVAMAGKADTGCVVSHRYPVLRGVPGIAMTEYLLGLLCTNHGDFILNENSRGAAGRNRPLNIRYLMKETIPVPSMHIQEAVACAIHSRAALLQEISNTINLLQERRAALISAAVTGQIDVRQQPKN